MTDEQLEALREWVRAEIEFALAKSEEGTDGYFGPAKKDEQVADRLFLKLKEMVR